MLEVLHRADALLERHLELDGNPQLELAYELIEAASKLIDFAGESGEAELLYAELILLQLEQLAICAPYARDVGLSVPSMSRASATAIAEKVRVATEARIDRVQRRAQVTSTQTVAAVAPRTQPRTRRKRARRRLTRAGPQSDPSRPRRSRPEAAA